MSTIVTRSGKGAALTHTEVDANFTNLNTDKAATADVILATQKGAVSGVCPLDATSKVAATYLPSYVDDVLEYANLAGFPVTGETGKIYVALDTNKTYRWSGSAYIYITSGAVDSVAGKTGVVTLTSTDVGLGNVTNTSDVNKPISTATQSALDLKASLASPTLSNPTYTGTLTGSTGILNIGSGQVYKDASGNVGIGTTAGNTKFTVQGASAYGIARFTTSDYVDGVSGSGILINTGATTGNTYTSINAYQAGYASVNNLILQSAGGGNVGIGTSIPSTKLTVAGAITITGAFALRGSYGAGAITSNFAAGDGALTSNTTGSNNSAMGQSALQNNTTGYNNSAVGLQALYSNTTGSNNSAMGVQALVNNTTGSSNSAMGQAALYSNTTGYQNSAMGQSALQNNTTGYQNSAMGQSALQNNTTGYNNSAVGLQALYSNTTGNNNSAVGLQALYSNTTGNNNSAVGLQALYSNTTGIQNSAMGVQALVNNTTGYQNSAVGQTALYSNTTGSYNSTVGVSALFSNTTGTQNSAVGMNALFDLKTTTIAATAIVAATAYQIVTMGTTTSAQWIASGAVTGTVGEIFTANATAGVGTGTVATSANVATQCLNNTALGYNTGRGITTGTGNTIIGASVTGLAAGLTNNIILANGTGSIRVQSNATTITFADVIKPQQATTAAAPAYVKGGMYFDTTLNKMRIGGATAWETITSV